MTNLISKVWWEAAGGRALRTAIVVAIPYIPASYLGQVPYLTILSAAVLAAILSLLTSLAGLPEVSGKQPIWWVAVAERVVKTIAQAAITAVGNALLLQNVHWLDIAQIALTAGFGSLLLAFLKELPEASVPQAVGPVAAQPIYITNPVPSTAATGGTVTLVPSPSVSVGTTVSPTVAPPSTEAPTKENIADEPTQ